LKEFGGASLRIREDRRLASQQSTTGKWWNVNAANAPGIRGENLDSPGEVKVDDGPECKSEEFPVDYAVTRPWEKTL
jgi:hypothetical protein